MTHDAGNPVVGICYGVLALLSAQDGGMMKGISLTIHNRADDFVTKSAAKMHTIGRRSSPILKGATVRNGDKSLSISVSCFVRAAGVANRINDLMTYCTIAA